MLSPKKESQSYITTPADLGYRMPAEWENQKAIWLAWPYNELTFEEFLPKVEKTFIQYIQSLQRGQFIELLVNDEEMHAKVNKQLSSANIDMARVHFHVIPNADVWIRDYGPSFVVNPKSQQPLAMVKWIFNAWGNKYDDLKPDNEVFLKLREQLSYPMYEPNIVLEGGSIDVNGQGTVLTTEQCLLNENRNKHLTKEQIETILMQFLNVQQVLWLKEGIVGDDTDGHIDDIARFVNVDTIVCAYEDDIQDENYLILKENYDRLLKMRNLQGKPFNIIKMPMPGYVGEDNQRLPASYLNFYIGNDTVVVPTFNHVNDKKALKILQDIFPSRKIVGIDCTYLVYGLGTLHCSSQQQPFV